MFFSKAFAVAALITPVIQASAIPQSRDPGARAGEEYGANSSSPAYGPLASASVTSSSTPAKDYTSSASLSCTIVGKDYTSSPGSPTPCYSVPAPNNGSSSVLLVTSYTTYPYPAVPVYTLPLSSQSSSLAGMNISNSVPFKDQPSTTEMLSTTSGYQPSTGFAIPSPSFAGNLTILNTMLSTLVYSPVGTSTASAFPTTSEGASSSMTGPTGYSSMSNLLTASATANSSSAAYVTVENSLGSSFLVPYSSVASAGYNTVSFTYFRTSSKPELSSYSISAVIGSVYFPPEIAPSSSTQRYGYGSTSTITALPISTDMTTITTLSSDSSLSGFPSRQTSAALAGSFPVPPGTYVSPLPATTSSLMSNAETSAGAISLVPIGSASAASISATPLYPNMTSSLIPVYTPSLLGNAYGGGYITTPSVFVLPSSSRYGAPTGVPPGYGYSLKPELATGVGQSSQQPSSGSSASVQSSYVFVIPTFQPSAGFPVIVPPGYGYTWNSGPPTAPGQPPHQPIAQTSQPSSGSLVAVPPGYGYSLNSEITTAVGPSSYLPAIPTASPSSGSSVFILPGNGYSLQQESSSVPGPSFQVSVVPTTPVPSDTSVGISPGYGNSLPTQLPSTVDQSSYLFIFPTTAVASSGSSAGGPPGYGYSLRPETSTAAGQSPYSSIIAIQPSASPQSSGGVPPVYGSASQVQTSGSPSYLGVAPTTQSTSSQLPSLTTSTAYAGAVQGSNSQDFPSPSGIPVGVPPVAGYSSQGGPLGSALYSTVISNGPSYPSQSPSSGALTGYAGSVQETNSGYFPSPSGIPVGVPPVVGYSSNSGTPSSSLQLSVVSTTPLYLSPPASFAPLSRYTGSIVASNTGSILVASGYPAGVSSDYGYSQNPGSSTPVGQPVFLSAVSILSASPQPTGSLVSAGSSTLIGGSSPNSAPAFSGSLFGVSPGYGYSLNPGASTVGGQLTASSELTGLVTSTSFPGSQATSKYESASSPSSAAAGYAGVSSAQPGIASYSSAASGGNFTVAASPTTPLAYQGSTTKLHSIDLGNIVFICLVGIYLL